MSFSELQKFWNLGTNGSGLWSIPYSPSWTGEKLGTEGGRNLQYVLSLGNILYVLDILYSIHNTLYSIHGIVWTSACNYVDNAL